jgi:tetratricopeptide (TPR) repeat protein
MKTNKSYLLLILLCFHGGIVFSQTINSDTVAAVFVRKFTKQHSGNMDSMNQTADRMIHKVIADNPRKAEEVLYRTGKLLYKNNFNDAALKCFRAALPLISERKNPEEYISCALAIANVFYKSMKADSAGFYTNLAYGTAKQKMIHLYDGEIYNNKARIADLVGRRLDAINWYLKAADFMRAKKDTASLGVILGSIGAVQINLDNYVEALKYLHESETYNEQQDNKAALNDTYTNLAVAYKGLGNTQESVRYYYKSINLSRKLHNDFQLARAFMNLATVYINEKKYREAEDYIDSSRFLCKKNNIRVGLILNNINQGQVMLETGRVRKGLELLLETENTMAGDKMPGILSELWTIISYGYEKDKQYRPALDYYKKSIALKDSIAGSETKRQVFELQTRYESERSARQIDLLQEKIGEQKNRDNLFLLGLGMSVVIILLLGALLIFYKRTQQYKQRLASEENKKLRLSMNIKDQELVSKAMNMAKINEMVLEVSDKMKQVMPGLTKEKTDLLQQLLRNLECSLPSEAWKEFETRFEQVHSGFYDNLLTLYPDLTPAELKICGFLRLNLTTKDIALLTNRTIGTIDHARSSIRRKMNLDNEANLTSCLLSL